MKSCGDNIRRLIAFSVLIIVMILTVAFVNSPDVNARYAVNQLIKYLQITEFDKASRLVLDSPTRDNSPHEDGLIRSGSTKVQFHITDVKIDGMDATVTVNTEILKIFNRKIIDFSQKATIITLKQVKGHWYIINNSEFQNFAREIFGYY